MFPVPLTVLMRLTLLQTAPDRMGGMMRPLKRWWSSSSGKALMLGMGLVLGLRIGLSLFGITAPGLSAASVGGSWQWRPTILAAAASYNLQPAPRCHPGHHRPGVGWQSQRPRRVGGDRSDADHALPCPGR